MDPPLLTLSPAWSLWILTFNRQQSPIAQIALMRSRAQSPLLRRETFARNCLLLFLDGHCAENEGKE